MNTPSSLGSPASLSGTRSGVQAVQAAVRVLWLYVLPALLAPTWLICLVPQGGFGAAGWIARAAHGAPVLSLAALFVAFSALAHHWRFHLPGGRYASALPVDWVTSERDPERLRAWAALAERYAAVSSSAPRRSVEHQGAAVPDDAARRLDAFRAAVCAGDLDRAQSALSALEAGMGAAARSRAALHVGVVALALAAALAGILLLRARVVEPYEILSDSMLPTLERGDRILANKLAYRGVGRGLPARGDVIVFGSSAVALGKGDWPDILAKRVIGLPGDHVEMQGGVPVINGWAVPSCDAGRYLYTYPDGETLRGRVYVESLGDRRYLTVRASHMPPGPREYVVGPGEVFVLGDNRSNSLDSRSWNAGLGGGVPLPAIGGRGQWSLLDAERGGSGGLRGLLRQVDEGSPRSALLDTERAELHAGIDRCLSTRPTETAPPPPGAPRASADLGGR